MSPRDRRSHIIDKSQGFGRVKSIIVHGLDERCGWDDFGGNGTERRAVSCTDAGKSSGTSARDSIEALKRVRKSLMKYKLLRDVALKI